MKSKPAGLDPRRRSGPVALPGARIGTSLGKVKLVFMPPGVLNTSTVANPFERAPDMHILRAAVLVWALFSVPGCAGVALTAGGIAGSTGVNHTLSGIAYKTFATPVDELHFATLKTLGRLDMEVSEDKETASGFEILALARDRKIEIELESLTSKATRMRVVVKKGGIFFKDAATATEIIIQTAETMANDATKKAAQR